MKSIYKSILIIGVLLISQIAISQEKQNWVNPYYTTPADKGLTLTEVSIDANQTVLWFKFINNHF